MDIAGTPPAPVALRVARHVAGMALVALANPLIYYDPEPVIWWLTGWAMPLAILLVLFGTFALFFTSAAKRAWPNAVLYLAWPLVILFMIAGWGEYNSIMAEANNPAPASEPDWEKGVFTLPNR